MFADDGLREALSYVQRAAAEYEKLDAFESLADVHYLAAVLHHNLGEPEARDAAARRNIECERRAGEMSALATDSMTTEVWALVQDVGTALSLRK
jgi:anaphase-promoting complex subunit 5